MRYFVKPVVLASVRRRYGIPLHVFAEKIKEDMQTIGEWERNGADLSTAKMELIADTIGCHWSVLLRDEPIPAVEKVKSKRTSNTHGDHGPATSTLITYRESYHLLNSIFLSNLPKLSASFRTLTRESAKPSAEALGASFRTLIGLDSDTRHKLRDQRAVYNYLVTSLEKNGVFVSEQELDTNDIRGFLISKDDTYLIVISSLDKFPASKLFTLLHEVGHILIGSGSSACDFRDMNGNLTHVDDEEKYCDSFAAAVLMPKDEFENDKKVLVAKTTLDNESLSKLASSYRTSYLAVVRRLYTLKLISYSNYTKKTKEFYNDILPQILARMREANAMKEDFVLPRSYFVNKELKRAGKTFSEFVIDRYTSGTIGSGEAKRLLGVDTRYLVEIEKKMVGTGN